MNDAERFLRALVGPAGLPEDERMIVCGFLGDPNVARSDAWRPRPWRPGNEIALSDRANAYVTVASFRRAADNSFRRRTETFCAGRALMVDDIGTKVTAKPEWPAPTAVVETSPGNQQWWYMLAEPERDMARFDGVIRAFIASELLGADPGMSGVTRVGRLPDFINGKPKYGGNFRTRLVELCDERYTVDALLKAFKLQINGRRVPREKLATEEAIERNRAFGAAFKFLQQRNMLKRQEPDPSGWTEIHCPWRADHTDGADTGAAVREPSPENDYYGAFRCHHGHCGEKGFADLTEWINDLAVEELEAAADDRTTETGAPQ